MAVTKNMLHSKKKTVKQDSNLQSLLNTITLKARDIALRHSSSYLDMGLSPPKAEILESPLMTFTNWICTAH